MAAGRWQLDRVSLHIKQENLGISTTYRFRKPLRGLPGSWQTNKTFVRAMEQRNACLPQLLRNGTPYLGRRKCPCFLFTEQPAETLGKLHTYPWVPWVPLTNLCFSLLPVSQSTRPSLVVSPVSGMIDLPRPSHSSCGAQGPCHCQHQCNNDALCLLAPSAIATEYTLGVKKSEKKNKKMGGRTLGAESSGQSSTDTPLTGQTPADM